MPAILVEDKVEKGKVAGLIYHITCDDYDATYVGETERSLKRLGSRSSVGSVVSQHLHVDRLEYGVSLDKIKILTVENRKFKR